MSTKAKAAAVHPAEKYVADVLAGRIVTSRMVRLACERHRRDVRDGAKRGLRFDQAAADDALQFFSLLRHSKGEWGGKPLILEPWQQFIISSIFGWKRADGTRRFRTAHVEVARKNGKSTTIAGLGLELAFFDGEPGAEVYCAATKKDQAKIVFVEALRMRKASPTLSKLIVAFKNNLNLPATYSKLEPLGADEDTLDGLNTHAALVDELHAHKNRGLWDVLETSTGARRQPLMFAITTAGFNRQSICWTQHQYGERILEGVFEDDSFFVFIAALDKGDDWEDEKNWPKANPNLGVSVKLDDLRRKAEKAKHDPAALNACVRVRSESLASAPLVIFKHLPNGGRARATDHPLYKVLHDRPNIWQTSIEFVEMMQAHLDLRGNAFARIVPGPRGAIDQLIPQHPDLVQVYRLPNGRLKYSVRSRYDAEIDWYTMDEIFHLRGLSADGLVGMSPVALQKEIIGNGLAKDDYEGRFFLNGAMPSGVLEYPGKFKDDAARDAFRDSWRKAQTQENQHRTAVLESGMKYTALGIKNSDAQFLESKKVNREEICGFYRVPPHKIGILERSTNNNIEHQGIEFVTDCMRPAAVRWERRINADLIEPLELGDGNEYFAEFILDGMLRGGLKDRYDAYLVGRNGGWLCPNDVCSFENLNPIPEEKGGDDYLRPVNYAIAGAPTPAAAPGGDAIPPGEAPDNPDDTGGEEGKDTPPPAPPENTALLRAFATEAGRRVVRKEVTALRKSLARCAADLTAFATETGRFYSSHANLVMQAMCIDFPQATGYAMQNRELIEAAEDASGKECAIDWIEDTAPEILARMALGKNAGEKASGK